MSEEITAHWESTMSTGPASLPEPLLSASFNLQCGIIRRMNASNNGTVNAVSPCTGLLLPPKGLTGPLRLSEG